MKPKKKYETKYRVKLVQEGTDLYLSRGGTWVAKSKATLFWSEQAVADFTLRHNIDDDLYEVIEL